MVGVDLLIKATKMLMLFTPEFIDIKAIVREVHKIEGVNKHHRKAFQWFCRAAEKGNKSGQYHLGMMYRNGQGVSIDIKKAVYWLHLSAEQNYLPSIIALQNIGLVND